MEKTMLKYVRKGVNKIHFLDENGEIFAALVRNKHGSHLVNAAKQADGKVFYQFGLSKKNEEIFGLSELTYLKGRDRIYAMATEYLGVA